MRSDDIRRRSRWMIRAQEWDEPRARYPNIWQEGMPLHVLAYDTIASRMRLGDLVAVYYPSSQRHRERSDRFLGLCRVSGLRRAHDPSCAWVDLETVHRFEPALDLAQSPRRVFMCCDPGWPERDVGLFRKVYDAAVNAGWRPSPEEESEAVATARSIEPDGTEHEKPRSSPSAGVEAVGPEPEPGVGEVDDQPAVTVSAPEEVAASPTFDADSRLFAGAAYSGDMRDPRDASWLAVLELRGERLRPVRLEATGRSGLHGLLRDPDETLMRVEAIGLGFPFSLPVPFAEKLLGGPFPKEGWWALARHMDRTSLPDYLVALQEFRDAQGELHRFTDEAAGAPSPLHRADPDRGSMAYHGIKMIAEERSRYAVRPFERARGKLLVEVDPSSAARHLRSASGTEAPESPAAMLEVLCGAIPLPLVLDDPLRRKCLSRRAALDALMAARSVALAVLTGETEKSPEELASGEADRVLREGWIYGLAAAPSPPQ